MCDDSNQELLGRKKSTGGKETGYGPNGGSSTKIGLSAGIVTHFLR